MKYKAFYRTYRPKNFNEVVGQEHIVRTLVNLIRMNKISHGYLFSGPRGTGKTSIARIFANAINCIHSEQPEQICNRCLENASKSLDIIEIDAASNNSVNDIRTIREQVEFAPTNSPYKIYIIDEVHMLTKGAFNALLLTLEEPPAHAIFIFATTNPDKIPDTILSRVQRYNFKKISKSVLEAQIKYVFDKEQIRYDVESVEMIASLANGSLRDALSIADQINAYSNSNINISNIVEIFGLSTIETQVYFLNLLAKKSISEVLQYFDNLVSSGVDISKFISSLIDLLKDFIIYNKTRNRNLISVNSNILDSIIFKPEVAYEVIDTFIKLHNDIKFTDIPQQLTQLAIIKICSFEESMIDIEKKEILSQALNIQKKSDEHQLSKTQEEQSFRTEKTNLESFGNENETKEQHNVKSEYRDITDEYFSMTQSMSQPIDTIKSNTETKTILSDFSKEDIESEFDLANDFSLDEELKKIQQNKEQNFEKTLEEKLENLREQTQPLDINSDLNNKLDTEDQIIRSATELLNLSNEIDGSDQEVDESLLTSYETGRQVFDTNEINVSEEILKENEFVTSQTSEEESYSFKAPVTDTNSFSSSDISNESFVEDIEEENIQEVKTEEFNLDNKNRTATSPIEINDYSLSQPKIVNLFLLSKKDTFDIFKQKLETSSCTEKEEYDSFAVLLKEVRFICSSNDFILVSSEEDWVIDDINQKSSDSKFRAFVSEYFGNNVHFYAITKKDYVVSKELYAELKKSDRVPEAQPLEPITNVQNDDLIDEATSIVEVENKSKSIFGSIFTRKKE